MCLLQAEAEAEKVRLEGKRLLEDAKKERISIVEEYRAKTEAEYDADMKEAADRIGEIADRFLLSLFEN